MITKSPSPEGDKQEVKNDGGHEEDFHQEEEPYP